jgi:hypothetical protein
MMRSVADMLGLLYTGIRRHADHIVCEVLLRPIFYICAEASILLSASTSWVFHC